MNSHLSEDGISPMAKQYFPEMEKERKGNYEYVYEIRTSTEGFTKRGKNLLAGILNVTLALFSFLTWICIFLKRCYTVDFIEAWLGS